MRSLYYRRHATRPHPRRPEVPNTKARPGTLAQYTRVPADNLIPVPPGLTTVQAAGITLAAVTAYQALFDTGGLQPEQSVFVNGGSTAVGAFAIQLAKAVGCRVAASASAKNEAYVRGLGADEVRAPSPSLVDRR